MQTFLPYPDFTQTAKCLDNKRLGNQRVEAKQILQCLLGEGSLRWKNHPAVKMWKGHEWHLSCYGSYICDEWIRRGFKDSLKEFFWVKSVFFDKTHVNGNNDFSPTDMPLFGQEKFHLSHQSNLVRKLPSHYRQYFPDVPDNLPYIWTLEDCK